MMTGTSPFRSSAGKGFLVASVEITTGGYRWMLGRGVRPRVLWVCGGKVRVRGVMNRVFEREL